MAGAAGAVRQQKGGTNGKTPASVEVRERVFPLPAMGYGRLAMSRPDFVEATIAGR